MGTKRTDEVRADAAQVALISELTRNQVASDLGVGFSTRSKWVTAHQLLGRRAQSIRPSGALLRLHLASIRALPAKVNGFDGRTPF